MPYIKDKNLVNIYEEVDKANQTINKLNKLLKEEEENNSILRKHRIILGIFGLLALILFLWSFLPKTNAIDEKYLIKNNLSLIDNDTLQRLKEAQEELIIVKESTKGIVAETIVYSIQIGAFNNFKARLFSDNLTHMKEFTEGGFNKYAIGNFATYAEALVLKEDLKRLGFTDCFIIAQSYGNPVNIREALELSEETQYLN
ncbi:SPOR domain-containing protein [Aureibaculum marinum]|uniref:SPOR domain-containing protein n=1 Tax=Aureibaculum marinum TaxID=2487930 RepID=A0A3N4NQJ7_9FLAO|nr:SPOR domain-containing protein [Aureibaculum marinum]RPD98652.1 SPOR domain-containing protein [Aureibaculum marinum]